MHPGSRCHALLGCPVRCFSSISLTPPAALFLVPGRVFIPRMALLLSSPLLSSPVLSHLQWGGFGLVLVAREVRVHVLGGHDVGLDRSICLVGRSALGHVALICANE